MVDPSSASFDVAKPSQPVSSKDCLDVLEPEFRKDGVKTALVVYFDIAHPSQHGSVVPAQPAHSVSSGRPRFRSFKHYASDTC